MKSATLLVIFSLFIMGIYAASTGGDLPLASETTNMPVAVDDKPTTSSTTTAETTEASKPKSTPTQAPTTTEAPTPTPASTTTEAPTTTTTTTTTTTKAPTTAAPTTPTPTSSTSTPAPIPTTPAPKPEEPKPAKYYVEEGGVKCILVEFATQLNISYGSDKYLVYNLPSFSNEFLNTTGNCGNETTEQNLVIIWPENHDENTLNLTFSLNTTSKPNEYSLTKAVFNLSSTLIPDNRTERVVLYHVGDFFETRKSRTYHCGRAQTFNLTETVDPKSKLLGNVTLSHVFMEAYRSKSDENFAESIDCDAINTPDIVPIAVGIALIALVVVVLIAYLVGRRRAQSRGYVSM